MQTMLKAIEPSPTCSSAEWRPVDPEELPVCWHLFVPLVVRALMRGEGSYNLRDVNLMLLTGQWQLWSHGRKAEEPESICITQVADFPRQRKLIVTHVAGNEAAFLENLHLVSDYAKSRECQRIEAYARKGWLRKLPDGWYSKSVILVKELDDGR